MMRTLVLVLIEMMQPVCVEARRTPNDAVHIVALGQQQLGPENRISTVERPTRKVSRDTMPND